LLVYDVERETTTRTAFVRALQQLRGNRPGTVAVRAVKIAGHDRTPLERCLLCGTDWALELSHSPSVSGQREITVVKASLTAQAAVQHDILERYWSVGLLAADPGQSDVHMLDL
jgi:hypothetical protein